MEDIVVDAGALPIEEGQVQARIHRRIGGSAAVIAQHLSALGVPTRLVTALGSDDAGTRLLSALRDSGVDVRWEAVSQTATTICIRTAHGGRSFITDATEIVGDSPSVGFVLDQVGGCTTVHLSGYWLFAQDATMVQRLGVRMREQSRIVSADLGNPSWLIERGSGLCADILSHLAPDVLVANKTELTALGRDDLVLSAKIVVTDGSNSIRAKVSESPVFEIEPGSVGAKIDPVGAGDVFAAALLSALDAGARLDEAVRMGCNRVRSVHGL